MDSCGLFLLSSSLSVGTVSSSSSSSLSTSCSCMCLHASSSLIRMSSLSAVLSCRARWRFSMAAFLIRLTVVFWWRLSQMSVVDCAHPINYLLPYLRCIGSSGGSGLCLPIRIGTAEQLQYTCSKKPSSSQPGQVVGRTLLPSWNFWTHAGDRVAPVINAAWIPPTSGRSAGSASLCLNCIPVCCSQPLSRSLKELCPSICV